MGKTFKRVVIKIEIYWDNFNLYIVELVGDDVMATKIAFILPNINEDGGQTVVCTLLNNLNKELYHPILFVLSRKVTNKLTTLLIANNIEVKFLKIKYDYKYIRLVEIIYWLNKEISKFEPDIINVHLDILYSWIWALLKRKRLIFTVHSDAGRISNFFSRKIFKELQNKNLIRVIGVSDFATNRFQQVFCAKEIQTIYNPVDIDRFQEKENNKEKEIIFINVARFHPVKNHKLLVDAFERLCVCECNTKLFLAGDGEQLDYIRQYVRQKNMSEKVCFLGYVDDISTILSEADVFVNSSLSEAFPVSILEALAAGLPVIATNVGGVSELVKENGILVPSEDVDALYMAMYKMVNDVELRIKKGKYSRELVKKFDIKRVLDQYEMVYQEESIRI